MKRYPRNLPPFPWLGFNDRCRFPDPADAPGHGLCAVGGNLSPGMLLSAYEQGLFPWYGDDEPIMWWSPDPRFILFPEDIKVSSSMRRVLNSRRFRVTADTAFPDVIRNCSRIPRKGQNGTWIVDEMIEAYIGLHEAGYAHSVEAWSEKGLAGGFYGISIGCGFFGESMFSLEPNASKAAFITFFRAAGKGAPRFSFIDCQVHTPHLESLGARPMERLRFLRLLEEAIREPFEPGTWGFSG